MILPLLLATGLMTLTQIPANPPTPTSTHAAYEADRDQAGRNASAQVKLALWCEAHGLHAERLRHLAMAALSDPNNAPVRGLMGIVRHGNQWLRPDNLAGQPAADPMYQAKMPEHHARRDHAATSANA